MTGTQRYVELMARCYRAAARHDAAKACCIGILFGMWCQRAGLVS